MSYTELTGDSSMDGVLANVSQAFGKATDEAWLRTRECDFNALVEEYKRIEAEFVARAATSEVYVLEIQRRITEIILQAAIEKQQSFANCQHWWNHLCILGFSDIERRCTMSWFYADGCLLHEQVDAGLAIVEPLIAELETAQAEPTCTERMQRFYCRELEHLGKLRDNLKALKK